MLFRLFHGVFRCASESPRRTLIQLSILYCTVHRYHALLKYTPIFSSIIQHVFRFPYDNRLSKTLNMLLCICIFAATVAVVSNPQPQHAISQNSSNLFDPNTGSLCPAVSFNHTLVNFALLRGKRNIINSTKTSPLLYLCCLVVAQSGDTHPNPGPRTPRYPCGSCNKAVRDCHEAILCNDCDTWVSQKLHRNVYGNVQQTCLSNQQFLMDLLLMWYAEFFVGSV